MRKRNVASWGGSMVLVGGVFLIAWLALGDDPPATLPNGAGGIQVVNIAGAPTNVFVEFVGEDGQQYGASNPRLGPADPRVLAGLGDSTTYFGEPFDHLGSFCGAATVFADRPIAAIGNHIFSSPHGFAYEAIVVDTEEPTADYSGVFLPLIVRDYFGVSSLVVIQNPDRRYTRTAMVTYQRSGGLSCTGPHCSVSCVTEHDCPTDFYCKRGACTDGPCQCDELIRHYTVQPGGSRIVDLANDSGFRCRDDRVDALACYVPVDDPCRSNPETCADGWLGAARVTYYPAAPETRFLAIAVNYAESFSYSYSGLFETGSTYYLPMIRSGFCDTVTGVQVSDADPTIVQPTVVRIEYSGGIHTACNQDPPTQSYDCVVEAVVPNDSAITFFNHGDWGFTNVTGAAGTPTIVGGTCADESHTKFGDAGGFFLGSAVVTATTPGAKVAVVVNDQIIDQGWSSTSSGAYTGFLASQAGSDVFSPLARIAYYGATTGTQVQNVGAASVTVVAEYQTSDLTLNKVFEPAPITVTIPPSQSHTFYLEPIGVPADSNNPNDPCYVDVNANCNVGWLGSVRISGPETARLVGITNDLPNPGDASLTNNVSVTSGP